MVSLVDSDAQFLAYCVARSHGTAKTRKYARVVGIPEPGALVASQQGVHSLSGASSPEHLSPPRIIVARAVAHVIHASLFSSCGRLGRGVAAPWACGYGGGNGKCTWHMISLTMTIGRAVGANAAHTDASHMVASAISLGHRG